ncbi:MAG: D-glycerate dehydrogenase [Hyphomicrobiaceae bacterium]
MSRIRKRLAITRRLPEAVLARAVRDYDAVLNDDDRQLDADALVTHIGKADGALVCITDRIGRNVVEALAPEVRIISTFSVGTDHIDLEAARERGIRVGNAPHGVTIATAEIAMLLILGAARRASEGEALMRAGAWTGWTPTQLVGRRLDNRVLGILGMGKIGQALARRARGFDMAIHYCNRRRLDPSEEQGAVYHESFQSLCAVADVISLNAPSTSETRAIVNAATIAWMKPGVIIVNTARGDLVADDDLIDALASGRVGYAGLDVYQGEPRVDPRYRGLANTFLLPHLGSAAVEARNQMGFEALDNLDAFFDGRSLPFPVA